MFSDKETLNHLIIKEFPRFLSILVGFFFGGIPFGMLLLFVSDIGVQNLTCVRTQTNSPVCTLQTTSFFGVQRNEPLSFENIRSARMLREVKRSGNECRQMVTYKTIIEDKHNERWDVFFDNMYFNCVKGDKEEMNRMGNRIQEFLDSSEAKLSLSRDHRFQGSTLFVLCFLSFFVWIGGAVFYLGVQYKQFSIDKRAGKIYWKNITLLGIRKKEWFLDDLLKVTLSEKNEEKKIELENVLTLHFSGIEKSFPLPFASQSIQKIHQKIVAFTGK